MAHCVLVGGEAAEWQGGPADRREFQHTSLGFVGEAYEQLRSGGVPRCNIIVIAQLSDYLSVLEQGQTGVLDTGIPPHYYAEQRERTVAQCQRLLKEGGAHYDGVAVNPGTVWSVLLGETEPDQPGPVVPADSDGAVVFAIYSHGDRHPTTSGAFRAAFGFGGPRRTGTLGFEEVEVRVLRAFFGFVEGSASAGGAPAAAAAVETSSSTSSSSPLSGSSHSGSSS